MGILLTILKYLGIILLVLLALLIVIIVIVLLVPLRYRLSADVPDPDSHSEFPTSLIKENAKVNGLVTWMGKAVRVEIAYPAKELLSVRLFGRKLNLSSGRSEEPKEKKKVEKKEEESSETLREKITGILNKIEMIKQRIYYYYRILTGVCGRRAVRKVRERLLIIIRSVLPGQWSVEGTIGLGDPYDSGRISEITSILYPVTEDHIKIDTEWMEYRFDLHVNLEGSFRLGTPVKQLLPLVLDKDCRKVFKKFRKVNAKLKAQEEAQKAGEAAPQPKGVPQTEGA